MSVSATNRAEIAAAFLNDLARPASETDLENWDAEFQSGGWNQSSLEHYLADTQEAGDRINDVYSGTLGRGVDGDGLSWAQGSLSAGYSLSDIRDVLATTTEATNAIVAKFQAATGADPSAGWIAELQQCLASGWSQADVANWLTSVTSAIQGIYQQVFGRAADPGGLATYTDAIATGTSFADVRNTLAYSGEAANAIIYKFEVATGAVPNAGWIAQLQYCLSVGWSQTDVANWLTSVTGAIQGIYQQVLGRTADPGGLATYTDAIATGTSFADIRNTLAYSGEATNDIVYKFEVATGAAPSAGWIAELQQCLSAGWSQSDVANWLTSVTGTVQGMYQQVLGRAADPGGLATYADAIATGTSFAEVQAALASGVEAYNDIMLDYQIVLNRNANAGEEASLQTQLGQGLATYASIRAGLETSAEAQGDIQAIYQQVWGRSASGDEVATVEGWLQSGSSMAGIRTAFAYSQQAADQINSLYEQVLGRPVDGGSLGSLEGQLAIGASLAQIQSGLATSQEAANDINAIYQQVLNHQADPDGLGHWEDQLALGSTLQDVRDGIATSPEAQADINGVYQRILGRAGTVNELIAAQQGMALGGAFSDVVNSVAYGQAAGSDVLALFQGIWGRGAAPSEIYSVEQGLAAGQSLASVRAWFAAQQGAIDAINTIFYQVMGVQADPAGLAHVQAMLANGSTLADVRNWVTSIQIYNTGIANYNAAVNAIYEGVLGREMNAGDWAVVQGIFNQGGTLATVRADVAQSPDAANVITNLYQITFGRPPSADELVGMQFAEALTITDTDVFGLYKADGTVLAITSPDNLLAQLPVAVTLYNGQTPILGLPGGASELFANATQLAACILALDLRQGLANVGALSAYQLTVNWLVQIDQPMLQVAANLAAQARLAMSEGNQAQATLAATAYSLALKIAALPPEARGGPNFGMASSVQVNGHTTVVIVYNDTSNPYGHVIYHDKAPDVIFGIIEQVVTIIVDVLAVIPVTAPIFAPIAVELNLAEAGQSFAEGNVLGGVLHIASAVGFAYVPGEIVYVPGSNGVVDVAATSANIASGASTSILAGVAVVGGGSTIVQNAENGDALGAIAGALTIAAAAASQIPSIRNTTIYDTGIKVVTALGLAAVGTAVSDALVKGDVTSALITSLGPLLSAIASKYQTEQKNDAVNISDRLSGTRYAQNEVKSDLGAPILSDDYSPPSPKPDLPLGHPDNYLYLALLLGAGGEVVGAAEEALSAIPGLFRGLYDAIGTLFEAPIRPSNSLYEIPIDGYTNATNTPNPTYRIVSGDEVTQIGTQVQGNFPAIQNPNVVLYRVDQNTGITSYQVYASDGLPAYRVDVTGASHNGVPTPHVQEFTRSANPSGVVFVGKVRDVTPAVGTEIP